MVRKFSGSLAGRIVLLLAGAMFVANLIAIAALSFQRGNIDLQARDEREIERIAALVPAMEAVSAADRVKIAREASTRFASVTVSDSPAVKATGSDPRSQPFAIRLAEALGQSDVSVALVSPPLDDRDDDRARRFFPPQTLVVSVQLSERDGDAAWLNVVAKTAPPPGGPPNEDTPTLIILIVSLLSVLIVSIILARLLTKPLRALSEAARAAGRGDRSARVPEVGPREMCEAASAFNSMQSQIARFDEERMRLLASVGHDLRTPITSLRIRAEMLDEVDEREAMIRTLDEMAVMAEGLVSYGREGRDSEGIECLDLGDLLEDLCAEYGLRCSSMPEIYVSVRPVGIRRAIGNLVQNALRYGGSANVSLSTAAGNALITVEDNGPGIAPERLDEMLLPFTRGDSSRSNETGGSGLGLSIARSIVVAHGGELKIENRSEGGLSAVISIPLTTF